MSIQDFYKLMKLVKQAEESEVEQDEEMETELDLPVTKVKQNMYKKK